MTRAWLLSIGLCAAAAAEQPPIGLKDFPREETAAENLLRREKDQASELASKYGVRESDVRSLRARGMGWGETERILRIALRAGRQTGEVADYRESGMGWAEIYERYGLSPEDAALKRKPPAERPEGLRDAVGGKRSKKAEPAARRKIRVPLPDWGGRPMPVLPQRDPREGRVEQTGEKGLLGK